jgi:hypothetical protein
MSLSRLLAAGAALITLAAVPALAQDYHQVPTYTTLNLNTGFTPDPATVQLSSGGSNDASALNNQQHAGDCRGMVAPKPDVRLNYTAGDRYPLIISAHANGDTTLVINGPGGEWYCNDDRASGDLNPAVNIPHPASGQYDIWVGTFGGSDLLPATLSVSEVSAP